jgi:hypothetical protein
MRYKLSMARIYSLPFSCPAAGASAAGKTAIFPFLAVELSEHAFRDAWLNIAHGAARGGHATVLLSAPSPAPGRLDGHLFGPEASDEPLPHATVKPAVSIPGGPPTRFTGFPAVMFPLVDKGFRPLAGLLERHLIA